MSRSVNVPFPRARPLPFEEVAPRAAPGEEAWAECAAAHDAALSEGAAARHAEPRANSVRGRKAPVRSRSAWLRDPRGRNAS
jgi:hypothetical protein